MRQQTLRSIPRALLLAGAGVIAFGLGLGLALAMGLGGNAATAAPQDTKPGLESITDSDRRAMEAAGLDLENYGTNESGQTYGTDAFAATSDEAPDLIAVWIDSDTIGYVYHDDYYPQSQVQGELIVTAYASDGKTVLAEKLSLGTPDR